MKRIITLGLFAIAVTMSSGLRAQQPAAAEGEILKVQADRNKAMLARDVTALEPILGDELLWGHSSSALETRTQFLERIRSGTSVWLKLEPQNIKIHVYGDTAVATGQLVQTTTGPGRKPSDRTLNTLEVFVKRDGRWRLVNFQATAVPDRPAADHLR